MKTRAARPVAFFLRVDSSGLGAFMLSKTRMLKKCPDLAENDVLLTQWC